MRTNNFAKEFTGKTVEEAIKKALQELQVRRHNLKIEVVSEEKKGLFGMAGAKPAKVRVTLKKDQETA